MLQRPEIRQLGSSCHEGNAKDGRRQIVKPDDEFSPKKAIHPRRLGGALFGAHQPVQIAGHGSHLGFERGEQHFGGQDPIVAGQRLDLLTTL